MALKPISTGIFTHLEGHPTKKEIKTLQRQLTRAVNIGNWLDFFEAKAKQNPTSQDCRCVLAKVEAVREALCRNDIGDAALESLQLGIFATTMEVRRHELPAKAGRAAPMNLAKGRRSTKDRHAKEHKEHAKWIKKANEIRDSFPSKRSCAFHVAHLFDANPETVYSVLKKKSR